jgi:hypothetical protein
MSAQPENAADGELFARLETITRSLVQDLKIAIENHATMAAGNSAVEQLRGVQWYGARSFNAIQRALTMDLALSLARLFDTGADVASISGMVSMLRNAAAKAEIPKRAAQWVPGLEAHNWAAANDEAEAARLEYQSLQGSARNELEALRTFRTQKLAHSLPMAVAEAAPRFQDLSMLLRAVASIVAHVSVAILGVAWDPSDTEKSVAQEAEIFWQSALGDAVASRPRNNAPSEINDR